MLTVYVGISISAATATTQTVVMSTAMTVCTEGDFGVRKRVIIHPPPSPIRNNAMLPKTNSMVEFSIDWCAGAGQSAYIYNCAAVT